MSIVESDYVTSKPQQMNPLYSTNLERPVKDAIRCKI